MLVGPKEKAEVGQGLTAFMLQGQRKAGASLKVAVTGSFNLRLPKNAVTVLCLFAQSKGRAGRRGQHGLVRWIRGGSDGSLATTAGQSKKGAASRDQAR